MAGENSFSENQFGVRKGKSTMNAIQAVGDITSEARKGTSKRKG